MSEKRRDSRNRILRRGESQGADGRYQYRYTDPYGQRKAVYSWRLVATDPIPAGKRDNLPLREQIKRINRDLQDLIAPDGGQITVLGLVKKYINQKRGVKLSTQAGYGTVINFLEKEPFGARKIDQVKLSDAKEWLIKLQREDGKSYSTLHTIRGVLRPAFQMTVDDDIIRKNPFDFLLATVVVNDSVTREALTRKEERAFLDFIKSDKHYSKYYDGMYILFKTGMRISKTYIDTTKTSAGKRVIPMTDDVYECFRRIIARRKPPKVEPMIDGYSGFLWFDMDKKPMVALHWEKYFQHAVEKYNRIYQNQLPKITPHVCRHTYCSNMAKAGMNPKVLQYLMGHSDIGVTLNTYTHLKLDDAKEEMEKLAKKQAKADDELRQMGKKSDGIRIRKFG